MAVNQEIKDRRDGFGDSDASCDFGGVLPRARSCNDLLDKRLGKRWSYVFVLNSSQPHMVYKWYLIVQTSHQKCLLHCLISVSSLKRNQNKSIAQLYQPQSPSCLNPHIHSTYQPVDVQRHGILTNSLGSSDVLWHCPKSEQSGRGQSGESEKPSSPNSHVMVWTDQAPQSPLFKANLSLSSWVHWRFTLVIPV